MSREESALVFSIVRATCERKAREASDMASKASGVARTVWLDVAAVYKARAARYEAAAKA